METDWVIGYRGGPMDGRVERSNQPVVLVMAADGVGATAAILTSRYELDELDSLNKRAVYRCRSTTRCACADDDALEAERRGG